MKIKELNQSKLPIVRHDRSLERYANEVLFPDKLKEANDKLASVGLPKAKNLPRPSIKLRKSLSSQDNIA